MHGLTHDPGLVFHETDLKYYFYSSGREAIEKSADY
jgi:hypothetical protein